MAEGTGRRNYFAVTGALSVIMFLQIFSLMAFIFYSLSLLLKYT